MKVIKGLFLQAVLLTSIGGFTQAAPLLINAQQPNSKTKPAYIRDHYSQIESLKAFDGMVITSGIGWVLMNGSPYSYTQATTDFSPLDGLSFTKMKNNFAFAATDRPADFFDDWSVTIENFRILAKVAKEKGLVGVFFDNEEYARKIWNYPDNCSYASSKTLQQYRDQARLRGKQIMQAMVAEFPSIVIIAAHGPYTSFSGTPSAVRGGQTGYSQEELRGPFTVGMIEGMGPTSRVVDGGEVYAYRTVTDFQVSYDFRKYTIATDATNCPFIPTTLRPYWPERLSISYGVYNGEYPAGYTMDPTIMQSTLKNALLRCDDYVWLYFEGMDWNTAGGVPQDWVNAVENAKTAALAASTSVTITSPTNGASFVAPTNVTINADASATSATVNKVEFFDGSLKLGEDLSAPYSFTMLNPTVGTHTLTAKATDSYSRVTTSSPVSINVSAAPVATSYPDLVITSLQASPENPAPGNPVTFSATVKNQGTAATPIGSAGGLFLGVGFQIDGQWVTWSDNYYGSLAPGASVTLTPNYGNNGSSTWAATSGTHTLSAIVDNMGLITESNESNNVATKTLVSSYGLPDLVITNFTWSPSAPATGNAVTFSVTVKNQGTAPTPIGSPGGLFLGVGFQIDGQWVTWCDNYYNSLAPGASVTLTPNYGNNGSKTWKATQGTHTAKAVLDNMGLIQESNETNNVVSKSIYVK